MRVAIVDAFSTSRFLTAELTARGSECIHVRSRKTSIASLERTFDPSLFALDLPYTQDVSEVAKQLATLGVERVTAGTDFGVGLADVLAERLGLPSNDPRTSLVRCDKYQMVEALRRSGLRAIRSGLITQVDEAVEWFESFGGRPVVVKPAMSGGTDGVRICTSAAEVQTATRAVLGQVNLFGRVNDSAIVQEYLRGVEYVVNSVSRDGVVKISDVWESNKTAGPANAPLYDYQEPQEHQTPHVTALAHYVRRAVLALGVVEGPAHSEVMLTEEGPILIETGARLMGSTTPDLSYECSGTSHVHLLVSGLLDPTAFNEFDDTAVGLHTRLRNVWLINRQAGFGRSKDWRSFYQALSTYRGFHPQRSADGPMPRTVDVATSPGFVSLVGTADAISRDHELIRSYEESGDVYTE